jgi:hypothetical protein
MLFFNFSSAYVRSLTACTLAILITGTAVTASGQSVGISVELLDSPAPVNSHLSRVVSDTSGQIYLSWVNEEGDLARFSYSQLTESGWSRPELISSGSDWFVNWADFPMLSVNGDNMAAHWLRMSAEGTYDYNIEASFSDVQNQDWSEPRVIHSDGVSAEHGFVSMLPLKDGSTLITWLDGRNTKNGDEYGEMTLRAGIFSSSGQILSEWELDSRACDCCQTSSAMTSSGPVVVYRDRSAKEIRDIAMTRYLDGQWTEPRPVHEDNWQIAGCPVNGPSVSARNEQVAVAWFTAKDDTPKVQLALSSDSGASFTAPVLVASPETNGRVGTALLDSGKIIVSWIDTSSAQAKIMLSVFSNEAELLQQVEVAKTSASRRSGFPIIESVGESVYVSWTDLSDSPQVRVARVSVK